MGEQGTRCECEHGAHVGPDTRWHRYGAVAAVVVIGTTYGHFRVCVACSEAGHMLVGLAGPAGAIAVGRGIFARLTCPKCGGDVEQGVCRLCGWPERATGCSHGHAVCGVCDVL
jgi:hypothetical protein